MTKSEQKGNGERKIGTKRERGMGDRIFSGVLIFDGLFGSDIYHIDIS
ncbi:hypothetical protein CKA32_002004 [Geitlerinema sp. FC II]|nr:hypothetical protein CKA32_002004 [Geitlerinema sp. FC II]